MLPSDGTRTNPKEFEGNHVHVLTKIFVVLVTLLTMAIVPLVVVNATNEATFKTKFKSAETARASAEASLAAERSAWMNSQQKLEGDLRSMESRLADLQKQLDAKAVAVRKAEQEVAGAKALQASADSSIRILTENLAAGTKLSNTLLAELTDLRSVSMEAQRRLAELEVQYDARQAELEVAEAARRQLQEEVKRLTDEKDQAISTVAQYVASYGEMASGGAAGAAARAVANRNLSATIINVVRGEGAPLAEINAGARDGVAEGWVLTIGMCGASAAVILIVVSLVTANRRLPEFVEADAEAIEARIARLTAAGADESELRELVRASVKLGRGQ